VPRFPVALRRTGIRFLGILVPPGSWAFVASGLPGSAWRRPRTLTGFPRSACASSDRGGCPLDPEASGVHTADEDLSGRRLPFLHGQALHPGVHPICRGPG
jgi:hypothetical protein